MYLFTNFELVYILSPLSPYMLFPINTINIITIMPPEDFFHKVAKHFYLFIVRFDMLVRLSMATQQHGSNLLHLILFCMTSNRLYCTKHRVTYKMSVPQALQKQLGARMSSRNAVTKAAKVLMKQKTGEDRAVLKKKLQDLEREWEKVCQMSVDRQSKLEDAYRGIGQFR